MDEQACSGDKPKPRNRLIAVAIGFGLFHAFSLVSALLPRDWAPNRLLEPYRRLTGTEQAWGMFYTIPTLQENAIAVEVTEASGASSERGPILPSLKPYRTHAQIRYYYLLNQLTDDRGPYMEPYLNRLGEAVKEDSGGRATQFSLRMENRYIRLLERIDEDGKMTLEKTETLGPFMLGGDS